MRTSKPSSSRSPIQRHYKKTARSGQGKDKDTRMYTATTTSTRRNANGSVSSVHSRKGITPLRKKDGIPLWRKDVQYDFLKLVFEDNKKVFHKASDSTSRHTFAEIYLNTVANSSTCAEGLKLKLRTEQPAITNAMLCLLVNFGRIDTTLSCEFDVCLHR